jgi:hypothetical protein
LHHGTPAAKLQSGGCRTARTKDHAACILEAIEQQLDPTLAELRIMLAERGVSVTRRGPPPRDDARYDRGGSTR